MSFVPTWLWRYSMFFQLPVGSEFSFADREGRYKKVDSLWCISLADKGKMLQPDMYAAIAA